VVGSNQFEIAYQCREEENYAKLMARKIAGAKSAITGGQSGEPRSLCTAGSDEYVINSCWIASALLHNGSNTGESLIPAMCTHCVDLPGATSPPAANKGNRSSGSNNNSRISSAARSTRHGSSTCQPAQALHFQDEPTMCEAASAEHVLSKLQALLQELPLLQQHLQVPAACNPAD